MQNRCFTVGTGRGRDDISVIRSYRSSPNCFTFHLHEVNFLKSFTTPTFAPLTKMDDCRFLFFITCPLCLATSFPTCTFVTVYTLTELQRLRLGLGEELMLTFVHVNNTFFLFFFFRLQSHKIVHEIEQNPNKLFSPLGIFQQNRLLVFLFCYQT